jgi:hypothetical protein
MRWSGTYLRSRSQRRRRRQIAWHHRSVASNGKSSSASRVHAWYELNGNNSHANRIDILLLLCYYIMFLKDDFCAYIIRPRARLKKKKNDNNRCRVPRTCSANRTIKMKNKFFVFFALLTVATRSGMKKNK